MILRQKHQNTNPDSEDSVIHRPGWKPRVATLMSPALFISSGEETLTESTSRETALGLWSWPGLRGLLTWQWWREPPGGVGSAGQLRAQPLFLHPRGSHTMQRAGRTASCPAEDE